MATVVYEGVSKQFGDVMAVHDFDLEVEDGEFVVFVGPSGSGKTTALRMLAGLETTTGGEVRIGERTVTHLRPQERNIAMVFQDYALYPQMTVMRNLSFGQRMRGTSSEEADSRSERTGLTLGIDRLMGRKPGELSGGQRQRVALGRALVREPDVFLMDEPLSNLDAKLRVQTRGEIARLQQQLGITTIYVTHDQVEAMTMGHRIVVVNDGAIEQVGPPDEVYGRPRNVFVAGFIGSPAMTFATCRVERHDGAAELVAGSFRLPAPNVAAQEGEEIIVGARPEHARLWEAGEGLIGPYTGSVTFIEALGRETFVGVELAEGAQFVVMAPGGFRVPIGEPVEFGLHPERLHLFAGPRSESLQIGL